MDLDRLTIATFNLFNLNKPGLPLYGDKDGWSEQEYAAKVAWSARQLLDLMPDVLGVQELWHKDALEDVVAAAGLGTEYDVVAAPAVGERIVCGALVRKGLLDGEPTWIDRFPNDFLLNSSTEDTQTPEINVTVDGFSRPVLHLTIAPRENHRIEVFVCHLKSKVPAPVYRERWYKADPTAYKDHATALGSALSTIRRTAEATALRMILTTAMKGTTTPVIVLGDLNDGQHSNTVNIITEQPRYLVGDSKGGGDIALYTGQTLQEYRDTRDVYYTHVHEDLRESLDHILVSEQFYDNSVRRQWLFDGLVINNDHLNRDDHKVTGTGDHGPVKVAFRWKPQPAGFR